MKEVQDRLFELKDEEYRDFQARLIPTVDKERIIGVRVPEIRKLAKLLKKNQITSDVAPIVDGEIIVGQPEEDELMNAPNMTPIIQRFIGELPHKYYDEDMLHAVLISSIKDYDQCIAAIEDFLPHVDNWAVCDTITPNTFTKNRAKLLGKIMEWCDSPHDFTCRFGLKMLMSHFLGDNFSRVFLEIPIIVDYEKYPGGEPVAGSGEYYVKMMVAWFIAEALVKQWHSTIEIIQDYRLDPWTHNMAIKKACDSLRLTVREKELLRLYRAEEYDMFYGIGE